MEAWSEELFSNDIAGDWAFDFVDEPALEKVETAIDSVLEVSKHLDSDKAFEALVACEIIARLKGNWGVQNSASESIDHWVETCQIQPTQVLVEKASICIDRILGENSELRESQYEDGNFEEWCDVMDDLAKRVDS